MKAVWIVMPLLILGGCEKRPIPEAKPVAPQPPIITQFYASKNAIARGEQALLCYGVEGAVTVRLDPPIEQIAPSLVRCLPYAPQSSGEIKLTAKGADGMEVSRSVRVEVSGVAPAPKSDLIVSFVSSASAVAAGQEVTLCYETRNSASVSIEPSAGKQVLPLKGCVTEKVDKKTQFTLIAAGTGGNTDSESLIVAVGK